MTYIPGLHQDQSIASVLADVARAHRILELEGHGDMSMGHLSFRDPFGRGLWLKRGNLALERGRGRRLHPHRLRRQRARGHGAAPPRVAAARRDHEGAPGRELRRPLPRPLLHRARRVRETLKPYNNHGVWFAYEGVPRFAETSHIITTVPLGVSAAQALGTPKRSCSPTTGSPSSGHVAEVTLTGIFLEKAARFQVDLKASGFAPIEPDPEETEGEVRPHLPAQGAAQLLDLLQPAAGAFEAPSYGIGISPIALPPGV